MSTGTVAAPTSIRGAFDPQRTNYFCGRMRLVRPGAPRRASDACVPHARMHAADRVRGVREDATTERRRRESGLMMTCADPANWTRPNLPAPSYKEDPVAAPPESAPKVEEVGVRRVSPCLFA